MDIVKYDNEFNLTKNFNKLSQVEQNIFFTITSEFTKTKKTQITLTADFIRQKINLQNQYRPSEIVTFLKNLSVKLSQIPFIIENDDNVIVTPIFAKFEVDKKTQETEVVLNREFLSYFYDIPFSFTQFELTKFVSIKSKYAKALFRYLLDLQHYAHESNNGKRYWTINYDEFKKIMVFPKSYQTTSIIRNLNKSIEEINKTGYIHDLNYTKEYDNEKKGRPIKSITFEYVIAKNSPLLPEQPQSENMDTVSKITKYFCPYCHKEVCKKNGPHGEFYGHKYYKQTTCKHTWSTLEELQTEISMVEQSELDREKQREQNNKNMDLLAQQRDKLFHEHGLMEEAKGYGKEEQNTDADPFPKG